MARVRESVKRVFRMITGCWHKETDIPPTAPSAIILPTVPSATNGQHVQQDIPSATSLIPPATPSATGGQQNQQDIPSATSTDTVPPEGSSATGEQHVQQDTSSATSPTAKSLWDRAYDALAQENPDLVNQYEELLAKEEPIANSTPNTTTHSQLPAPHALDTRSDRTPRQVQLDTVIHKGLRRMEDNRTTYTIAGHEFDLTGQITKAAKILVWSKEFIGAAVKASPEASLVWSGVCLILPLLTNPTTAAEANKDGFAYVTSRLRYYAALEPMVRRLGQNTSVDEALVTAANGHILDFYKAILDFQLSSVLRFYRSRLKNYVRDIVTSRDWEQALIDIKTREQTVNSDLGQINDLAARQELENLNTTSEGLRSDMGVMLPVVVQQLDVQQKQLNVEQRREQRGCLQAFWLTDNGKGAAYHWYKDRVETRVEGTCKWFLQHEYFQKWLLQDSGPLLVSADPGCGKSVLAKYLIDEGLAKQSATICYFFFKDQDQNTTRQALCALLHQLFFQKSALIQHAMELYDKMGADLNQSEILLWTILRDAVRDPQAGPVIFVIDALDECDESQLKSLIQHLKDFFCDQRLANAKFKVLMTSRPYLQVFNKFKSLQSEFQQIHIPGEEEFEAISQEINSVIHYRVEKLAHEHRLSDEVKSSLNSKLLAIKHRTYLWVYLVFEHLEKGFDKGSKKTEAGIDAAIRTLPMNVNEAYDQILNRSQEDETVNTVKNILSIILAARRPLTLSEMNIAMNLDGPGRGQSIYDLDLDQDMDIKSRLRALCGLFVNIHHDRIYFLHQTAREFLIQSSPPTTVTSNLQWHHSITARYAHYVLAEVCMFYLDRLSSTDTESFREDDRHGALLEYSVKYWGGHCLEAEPEKDSAMVDFALGLCTSDLTSNSQWASIVSSRYHIRPASTTNVLLASRLGLTPVAELLLIRGASIEAKTSQGRTALMYAATYGHEAVTRLLLDKGADVEAKNNDGMTTLMLAAGNGHEAITRLLLVNGANIEAKNNECWTALMITARSGNDSVTRLLLDNGAGVEAKDSQGRTALMLTARFGHEAVTRLLLDKGANVEASDHDGETALMLTAGNGHEAITQLLLDKGADIEAKANDGGTALMYAARSGHEAVTRLLLDKGADIEAKNNDGWTALTYTSFFQKEAVRRLLIDNGANVKVMNNNGGTMVMRAAASGDEAATRTFIDKSDVVEAKNNDDKTALIYAAAFGNEAVTRLLLEKGADIEAKKNDGRTALMQAAANSHEAVTRLLLDIGADIEAKDNDGWTALAYAAAFGHAAVARLLLDRGADVEAKMNDGRTALIYAATYGHEAVARLLIDKGADVEAKDNDSLSALRYAPATITRLLLDLGANVEAKMNDGRTALMHAASDGDEAVARLLLDKGADVEAKDNDGRTALIYAAEPGNEAVTRLLLDKGADVEAKNNDGRTALMHAASDSHEVVTRLLLEYGADGEAKDNDGWSALIYAASDGHEAVTRLLLDKGADVEAKDNDGRTALTHAAENGHEAVIRLLLEKGADVEAKDNDGWPALNYAPATITRLLLDHGAKVEAKDFEG